MESDQDSDGDSPIKILLFRDSAAEKEVMGIAGMNDLHDLFQRSPFTLENFVAACRSKDGMMQVESPRIDSARLQSHRAPRDVELCGENRIDIKTLRKGPTLKKKYQEGKFFLCRTTKPAVIKLGCDVDVEDPNGGQAELHLTYFTAPKKVAGGKTEFLGILPPGSFLAVKNPTTEKLPRVVQVSSNNPGDVVILTGKRMKELFPGLLWKGRVPGGSFWDKILRTDAGALEALKRKGNEAFVYKRYTDAIRCYDMALEYVGELDVVECVDIWSNKAAAFLGFGCLLKGLECCDKVLAREPNHVKCIHRKVKALVGLGRGSDALKFLTETLDGSPTLVENEDLRNLRAKIPQPGTIPSLKTLTDPLATFGDFTPEYVGPVEYRPYSNGRGLFATEDMNPGDVIFSHPAFADIDGFVAGHLGCYELIRVTANKIAFSPELGPEIYKLWAGQEMKNLGSDDPENGKVNIERIREIVESHSYKPLSKSGTPIYSIFTMEELMNHSCSEANAMVDHPSNWIFSYVTKPIKRGQEILNDWFETSLPLEDRKEKLEDREMICNCRLCLLETAEGPKIQEEAVKIVSRLKKMAPKLEKSQNKLRRALDLISDLEKLRPSTPDLSLVLIPCDIRLTFCKALLKQGMLEEGIILSEKVFVGEEVMNHSKCALAAARNALRGNLKLKNLVKVTEWAEQVNKYGFLHHGSSMASEVWVDELIAEMEAAGIDISKPSKADKDNPKKTTESGNPRFLLLLLLIAFVVIVFSRDYYYEQCLFNPLHYFNTKNLL